MKVASDTVNKSQAPEERLAEAFNLTFNTNPGKAYLNNATSMEEEEPGYIEAEIKNLEKMRPGSQVESPNEKPLRAEVTYSIAL